MTVEMDYVICNLLYLNVSLIALQSTRVLASTR